jgi:hypothetical protein
MIETLQTLQTLDDLHEISRNIHARMNDRIAADPEDMGAAENEAHWLIVLREELELAEEEAGESNRVAPETYRSGYDQGWADAIRVILDARSLIHRDPGTHETAAQPAQSGREMG